MVRVLSPVSDAKALSEALNVLLGGCGRFAFSQRARYNKLADGPILEANPLLKNLLGNLAH
jgi:hypothetical protein